MMWRGTLFSVFLHGSIVAALVVGLPILPDIFKRKPETIDGSPDHAISVEIVSAESVDLRQDVIALDKPPPLNASRLTATGTLPTLAIGPAEITAPPDTVPPAAAAPMDRGGARTRLPEGSLARPDSVRSGQNRSSTLLQRLAERARRAQQAPKADTARRDMPAGEQPAQPNPVAPGSAVTAVTAATAATSAAPDLPANATTAPAPAKTAARLAAASGGNPVERNQFVQAVSGDKRDLVLKMLSSDKRLLQAVTPRPDADAVPAQARLKTMERLAKAAEAGFYHAQFNLAGKYLRGEGVPSNPGEALKLLTRAAQQGFAPAQSLLGLMRFTGFGVPQNQAESAFWWSLAADAGDDGAKTGAALLKNLLKPTELVQSKRLRARWGSLINGLTDIAPGNTNRRDPDSALRDASEQGDIDAVLSLLARGADADKAGEEGRNAVIGAAWRGRTQIIQLLLDRGVETELPDSSGRTPLIWAAINGHDEIVARLVKSGANPDRTDSGGGTALIRAAWNGHAAVVRNLIDAGADVNARDGNGLTALAHATREGNNGAVRALRDAGAR